MDTVEVKEDIKKEDVKTAETKEATTSAEDVKKEQKKEAAADKASSKEDTKKDEVKKSEVKKEEKKPEEKKEEQPKSKDAKVTSKIKHFDTPVAIHRGPSKNTEVFTFVGNISVLEEVGEFSRVQYVVPGVGKAEGYTLTDNLK